MYWDVRGQYELGRKWLLHALGGGHLQPEVEVRTQAGASYISLSLADPASVRQHAYRALSLWRGIGEPVELVWFATWSLCDLAFASLLEDDVGGAIGHADEALATAPLAQEPSARARALFTLGFATERRDLQAAEHFYQEALSLARRHDMQLGISRILTRLAGIAMDRQETEAAMAILEEAVGVARTLDDKAILGNALLQLAALEDVAGNETAATHLRFEGREILEGIGLAREVGSLLAEAAALARGVRDGHVPTPDPGSAG